VNRDTVSVTLSPQDDCFVISVDGTTIRVSPRQFQNLLEESIAAAAQHIDAHEREKGKKSKAKNVPVEAIRSTAMGASADLGATQIVTRIEIGPLALHFAAPRNVVIEYCAEVMGILQAAGIGPPSAPMQ